MIGCPIIILISMSNVTGTQYMVPLGMYKEYSASVIAGALINLIVNLFLIPRYGAYGAVIGSVIAELTVTLVQFYLIRKSVTLSFKHKSYFIYLISSRAMALVIFLLTRYLTISKLSTLLEIMLGMLIYFGILLICKEEILLSLLRKVFKREENA